MRAKNVDLLGGPSGWYAEFLLDKYAELRFAMLLFANMGHA